MFLGGKALLKTYISQLEIYRSALVPGHETFYFIRVREGPGTDSCTPWVRGYGGVVWAAGSSWDSIASLAPGACAISVKLVKNTYNRSYYSYKRSAHLLLR